MDQSLQILIKTIADLKDGDLTIKQQKELEQAIKATGAGAELTVRQMRTLEQAAAKVKAPAAGISPEQSAAGRVASSSAVKPPKIPAPEPPEEEKQHSGTTMRRHFGAVAGQLLGMPGLGMLAAAGGLTAGIGIAVSLMEKAGRVALAWNAAIQEVLATSRGFETYEQRVDSLSLRTQNLRQHNDGVALSLGQIERQVNNTANAVSHYLDLLQTQSTFGARVEDAQLKAALARINLEQRFNPAERIRQTEAAEEAAYQRRMAREKQEEQNKLAAFALQEKLATARKAFNQANLADVNAALPERQHTADLAADELKNVEKQTDAREEKLEAERALVKQMAEGSIVPGAGIAAYGAARAKLVPTEGFTDLDKSIAADPAAGAALTLGVVPPSVQAAAKKRLADIDKAERDDADKRTVARAKARATAHDAGQLERQQSIYEKGVEDSESKRQEALRDAGQLKQKIQIETPARATEERDTIDAMRKARDLEIRQQERGPSARTISSVGTPPADPHMMENNRLLAMIASTLRA